MGISHRNFLILCLLGLQEMLYIYIQFSQTIHSEMLFKSFEKQVDVSPFSSIVSQAQKTDQETLPQDNFALNRSPFALTLRDRAEEIQRSVLEWLGSKGVVQGHPEQLRAEFTGLQLRKVISSQESGAKALPGLLERRLSRKMAIKV